MDASSEMTKSLVLTANEAGAALSTISQAIDSINEKNAQIANASSEQKVTSESFQTSTQRISSIAEDNGQKSTQVAHAASKVKSNSESINQLICRFTV